MGLGIDVECHLAQVPIKPHLVRCMVAFQSQCIFVFLLTHIFKISFFHVFFNMTIPINQTKNRVACGNWFSILFIGSPWVITNKWLCRKCIIHKLYTTLKSNSYSNSNDWAIHPMATDLFTKGNSALIEKMKLLPNK